MTIINNVKWVSASQLVKVVCQLAGMVIFSRYLTPSEFGVMSMTLVVSNFVSIIRDMGFSAAIIQRERLSKCFLNTVFYFNVFIGIVLFTIVFSSSAMVSHFFKEPELKGTLKAIALAFPLNSITAIHLSLLERNSKFLTVAKCESISSIMSLSIASFFAYMGAGVYSLVIQTLLYSFLSASGFWFSTKWKPQLFFSFKELISTSRFSFDLVSFNFINYFSRNSDQIIIGKSFGSTLLGQYSLAYRIMLFPLQNITYVLTRSLFPILSRMQNDKIECNNIYINTVKSIVLIVTPLMFGLASIGYEFVPLVFGAQWRDVASLLIWLAPTAVLQSQISTTGAVFMSQGRTSVLLWLTIFNAFLQIGAFIVGSLYDINTIVILYFAANLVMYFPNMLFAVSVLGGSFLSLLKSILLPILFGILMFASLLYIKPYILFFMNLNPNSITFLIIQIFLGFLIYTMLILIFERDDLRRFRGSLRKRNNIL
ncbi:lipopolysaccharide biosynthesis protein [Klebsiella pneumoniae]|uniref:lipopolysaccharide biosynthesis protein n=1 Tax=Klebsiella pneumoniae TaxID=573 RepID=UPI0020CC263F|nr:lipopolysaccharide biosynthesis protein [Klebsiella pneumoniae]